MKLQGEIKSGKTKLRAKSHEVSQQEKLLEERNKLIEQHSLKEKELEHELKKREDEIQTQSKKISELEATNSTLKTQIESNDHGMSRSAFIQQQKLTFPSH